MSTFARHSLLLLFTASSFSCLAQEATSPKDLLKRGDERVQKADYARAIADYSQVIEAEPKNAAAFAKRAKAQSLSGAQDKALADAQAAVDLDPQLDDSHLALGIVLTAKGDIDKAASALQEAVKLNPENDSAQNRLGVVFITQRKYAEAIAALDKAITAKPTEPTYWRNRSEASYRSGDYKKSLEDATKAIELDPKLLDAYRYSAYSKEAISDFDGAISDTNKALELVPEDYSRLADRGRMHRRQNKIPEAISDMTRALEVEPRYVYALQLRGQYYRDQQNWEGAAQDFEKVVEISPTEADFISLGSAYQQIFAYETAIEKFSSAASLNPRGTEALRLKAETYALLGKYPLAIKTCDEALLIEPKSGLLTQAKAGYLFDSGEFAESVKLFATSVELDPTMVLSYFRSGQANRALNELDAALADFTKFVAAVPKSADGLGLRAKAHAARKEYAAAIEDYTKAIEVDPLYTWGYFNRGILRVALQQMEEAEKDFAKAKETGKWTDDFLKTMRAQSAALLLTPTTAAEYVQRGTARRMAFDRDGAFGDLVNALAKDPKNLDALWQRALNNFEQSRYYVALTDVEKGSEIDPKDRYFYSKAGECYLRLGRWEAAINSFGKALEVDPKVVPTLCNRSEAQRLKGNFAEALADAKKASDLNPAEWYAPRTRGLVLYAQGKLKDAQDEFEATIRLAPVNKPFVDLDIQKVSSRKNPFGIGLEIDPVGDDVAAFAKANELTGKADDPNAERWQKSAAPGEPTTLTGSWSGRWKYADKPNWANELIPTKVAAVGNRVFILFTDGQSTQLIVAVRDEKNPNKISGRAAPITTLRGPALFTGLIVDGERIDGAWKASYGSGRWDFRRTLEPAK